MTAFVSSGRLSSAAKGGTVVPSMTGNQESIKLLWVRWFEAIWSSTKMESYSGPTTSQTVAPTSSSIQQTIYGEYASLATWYDFGLIIFKNQESHATAFLAIKYPTIPQQQIQEQRRVKSKERQGAQSRTRNRHRCRRLRLRQP